jgi:hypothetical protein
VAQRCGDDGMRRLAGALGLQADSGSEAPPPQLAAYGSGAVVAHWDEPLGWRLLLAPGTARAWHSAPGGGPGSVLQPLANVLDALSATRLLLQVELADCELELRALQSLRPGDVVRLPQRLDAPATVRHAAGGLLCAAHLGRQGGAKAAELAPA